MKYTSSLESGIIINFTFKLVFLCSLPRHCKYLLVLDLTAQNFIKFKKKDAVVLLI